MRVALAHVFFKVVGVLLWFGFIDQLKELVMLISEGNPARQIANAHTIFNTANTFFFIWLVNPVSKLILWLLPERVKKEKELFPELHSYFLEDTSMALDLVTGSIIKLGNYTLKIIEKGITTATTGSATDLIELRKKDHKIDKGHTEILGFLQKIQSVELTTEQVERLESQLEAVNVLETAADLITTNLVEAAEHRIENNFTTSETTLNLLSELYNTASKAFASALNEYNGKENGGEVNLSKEAFKLQLQETRTYLAKRLAVNDDMRIPVYRFESEVLETIRRLHGLARRLERKAG